MEEIVWISRHRGRKSFEPPKEQRKQFEAPAAYGIPHDNICRLLLNPKTAKLIESSGSCAKWNRGN
jgi:hypothetical protein